MIGIKTRGSAIKSNHQKESRSMKLANYSLLVKSRAPRCTELACCLSSYVRETAGIAATQIGSGELGTEGNKQSTL